MKKLILLFIPFFAFADFSNQDSAALGIIDENVDFLLNTFISYNDSFTAMRNNQIAPMKTDLHNISTYVEYIKNNLPSSSTTNQFIDYSSYLSAATPNIAVYPSRPSGFQKLNPDWDSYSPISSSSILTSGDKSSPDLLLGLIRILQVIYQEQEFSFRQNAILQSDTRNVITNNLTYQVTSGLGYQYQIIGQDSDISSLPNRQSRSILPVGPYSTSYLLFKLLQEQGYIGSTQSYYLRDFVLQLQDIRRLLAQHSLGSTNIVNVGITNIVDIAQLDPLWRGIGEEFDIGRLWSEVAITPNKDGDVIQETYLSHYDDLSTHFFEAVPELILMGVRQRKSVNTTLFNVLTNIQIHTTLLRSIDNNVGIIASNFNYQTQVEDSSAEVRGNITEAQSTLRIAWENDELPNHLQLDFWGENIQQPQLPDEVVLDFSDIVHDINWGFFNFKDVSPNEFVLTANLSPYRSFFAFVRGIFIFFYVCIAILFVSCVFFLCTKLFMFISTIISTNSL